jgi:tetrahydromethanopterin S-methyltransferase subunit G
MNKKQLHEKLQQLHAELDQVECSDNQREILQKVASDIQILLARQDEGAEHYRDLGERLKEAVAQLEASHPEATSRIRQMIDQLAYLGI